MTLPLNYLAPRADTSLSTPPPCSWRWRRTPEASLGQILDELGALEEVVQRLSVLISGQGGGEAGHHRDQALVQSTGPRTHSLLVLS